jgi:hypothetical protein
LAIQENQEERMGKEKIADHWDTLASNIRSAVALITDERLDEIYRELYAKGYNEDPVKFPLSKRTRQPEKEIRYAVLGAVATESIQRRLKKRDNREGQH